MCHVLKLGCFVYWLTMLSSGGGRHTLNAGLTHEDLSVSADSVVCAFTTHCPHGTALGTMSSSLQAGQGNGKQPCLPHLFEKGNNKLITFRNLLISFSLHLLVDNLFIWPLIIIKKSWKASAFQRWSGQPWLAWLIWFICLFASISSPIKISFPLMRECEMGLGWAVVAATFVNAYDFRSFLWTHHFYYWV